MAKKKAVGAGLEYTPAERSYIERCVLDARALHQKQEVQIRHIRQMRTLQLNTRTPKSWQRLIGQGVRAPISYSLIQTVVGMLTKGHPTFSREPLNPGDTDKAAKVASACWPMFMTFEKMSHGRFSYVGLMDQLIGDGRSVCKLRRQRMTNFPTRLDGESDRDFNARCAAFWELPGTSPLRLSLVDPSVFKPDLNEETTYVVETGRRMLGPLLGSLGLDITNSRNGWAPTSPTTNVMMQPMGFQQTVQIDEVWTDEFCYFNFDGQFLKFENEFGFIPYAWRNGMTTSIPDPAYEALPVAFPFYAIEPYINVMLTAGLSWAIMTGMPTAVIETLPGPGVMPGDPTMSTDLPLGQTVNLGVGRKFSYAVPPPMGQGWADIMNMFLGLVDRAGVTQAVRGVTGTRMPGLTLNTAIDAAKDMFNPAIHNAEGLLEDIVVMVLKAIEALDIKKFQITGEQIVTATGQKKYSKYILTPAMINGYYDIHCNIKPLADESLQMRGQHAAFMDQHNLWSKERAMIYSGIDNVEEERLEMAKDMVRSTPLYQRQLLEAAMSDDPELMSQYQEAKAQGQDLLGLEDFSQGLPPDASGEVPTESPGGLPGGQIRGLPAPTAGGRTAGAPRMPTGPQPGVYTPSGSMVP